MFLFLLGASWMHAQEQPKRFGYSKETLGKVPAGWTAAQTGKGAGSIWKVVRDDTAPSMSGLALAQTAESQNSLFNLCVVNDASFKDVEAKVSFKANEGIKDQGGGIVWRYQDSNNYYVARMNPLENNFRVYKVVDGKRQKELRSADAKATQGKWHTIMVRMTGDHIECFLDDKKLLDVADDTFAKAGKVGLWTKADARTSFDQLEVKELAR